MIWYILSAPFWVMGTFLIGVLICGMLWASVDDIKNERIYRWDAQFSAGCLICFGAASILLWVANWFVGHA